VDRLWKTVPRWDETRLSTYVPRPRHWVRLANPARAGRGLRRRVGERRLCSALSRSSAGANRPCDQLPVRLSGLAILACIRILVRHTLIGVRRRVMSGGDPPGSGSASDSTSGASALEWLELAQGTTREALAERLAQAHLTDLDKQSMPTGMHTRRAAGKH
jgi:hypothetical protein